MQEIDVFVDEAGDLGFHPKSSSTFVIAYFMTHDVERIRIDTKRLLKCINLRNKHDISEFKFSRDSETIRNKFFNLIKRMNVDIGYVAIEKKSVKKELRDKPAILYNYLTVHYIVTTILRYYQPDKISFIIDRSLTKESRTAFNDYFVNKASWTLYEINGNFPEISISHVNSEEYPSILLEYDSFSTMISISHVNSEEDPCIQVADYLAGAAFSKFERDYSTYFDLIRDKVKFNKSWGRIV